MFYATILNFLAGSVTGALYKVQALLILLGLVLIEFAILVVVRGEITWEWAILNLINVQVGYFAGICARAGFETLTGQKDAEADGRERPAGHIE